MRRTAREKDYYFYKVWKNTAIYGGIALIAIAVISFLLCYFFGAYKMMDFYDDVRNKFIMSIVIFGGTVITGLVLFIVGITALRIKYNEAKRLL